MRSETSKYNSVVIQTINVKPDLPRPMKRKMDMVRSILACSSPRFVHAVMLRVRVKKMGMKVRV